MTDHEQCNATQAAANTLTSVSNDIEKLVVFVDDIVENGGARSKIFTSGQTGKNLVANIDDLSAYISECREASVDLTREVEELDKRCEHYAKLAQTLQLNYLKSAIDWIEAGGKSVVCVLAPLFTDENVVDGYCRRIRNIDELIPESLFRIYVFRDENTYGGSVEFVGENYLYVTIGTETDAQPLLKQIARCTNLFYCHSIYRFDEQLLRMLPEVPLVLDFHGSVPEEIEYLIGDTEAAERFEAIERAAVERASTIVVVSENMTEHIRRKHADAVANTRFITLPIFDMHRPNAGEKSSAANGKPTVVYAGGTQRWQLVDLMLDAIEKAGNACDYRLFIPDAHQFDDLWGNRKRPRNLSVGTRPPELLPQEYASCQFGFVLREDCTVNRVACPTKLVEYMVNDVIPIVLSPNIGDFGNDGMEYVRLDNFLHLHLPDEAARAHMLEKNRHVLEKQTQRFERGSAELRELLEQAAR